MMRWILILWVGVFCLSFCVSVAGVSPNTCTMRVEWDKSTGEIGIFCDLPDLAGSDPMALLLEVEIPAGWRVQEITAGEGAKGLTLTYGGDHGRVRILLDGVCHGEENRPILWIRCEKTPDFVPNTGGYMGVTGAEGGKLTLYILRDGGLADEISLSVQGDGWWGAVTDTTDTTEENDEDIPFDTADPPATETTTEEVIDVPLPPPPTAVFLGCRETQVIEGVYGVQFLFGGEGDGTPILCMEGGGVLYAECGKVEDVVVNGRQADVCTLWGLLANRWYEFWIPTEGGWITVTYEGGEFMGFGWRDVGPTMNSISCGRGRRLDAP